MASPFRIFRKHQKFLMATLGIMAIIAFTILGIVLQILQGHDRPGSKNPVVVTTEKYGDLHEIDLDRMREIRRRLSHFLLGAVGEASRGEQMFARIQAARYLRPLGLAAFNERAEIVLPSGLFSEETTVRRWLMVQRARELGLIVTDETISQFLRNLTDNRVANEQFAAIYNRFGIPEEVVFNALHDELLASNLGTLVGMGLDPRATTPAERWDYFQRLKRKIELEVAPVSVAEFVDIKEDPGDRVLEKFFKKYKNNFPSVDSPEPGFRERPKVDIEYVKADIEKFADPASVTDEEIKAYYDEHRELYRNIELPALDFGEPASALPALPDMAPPQQPEARPEGTPTPVPGTDPKDEEPVGQPTDKQPTDKTSRSAVRSPFRLVSMGQQEEDKTEQAPAADDAKPSEGEKEPEGAEPAAALPELPADPPATGSPAAEQAPSAEKPAATEPTATKPEFKPLEEVKDEIRNTLAREKVRERILQGFQPIRANMSKQQKKLINYEASKGEPGGAAEPPTFDLAPLADPPPGSAWVKRGWKLVSGDQTKAYKPEELVPAEHFESPVKTGLITAEQLAQLPLALSRTESDQWFLREAFGTMTPHVSGVSWDVDGNSYLFWKVAEVEERVPEFDEPGMRGKVLAAWRFVQARKAALEHAQELADEARRADTSLADSIGKQPGVVVSKTGPFTWLTTGTLPAMQYQAPLRMSIVEHVDSAGDAFMRTAYGLAVGQVDVAMNYPENTVYVMRLVGTSPLEKVLQALFEVEPLDKYRVVAEAETRKMFNDWYEALQRDAGLDWKRPAEQPKERGR